MDLNLQVKNLSGGYLGRDIVRDISFEIKAGDILCLLGPNGCGKSTLLKLILAILPLSAGQVLCRAENIKQMSRKRMARIFSYIPQNDNNSFNFTVLEMVLMARSGQLNSLSSLKQADYDLAKQALSQLKIEHLANDDYNQLSGGQRQLVLIARALCQQTCILIMDEPTANLDFANQRLINEAILLLAKKGKMVIISSHSPEQPFLLNGKVLLLNQGQMLGFGCPEQVLSNQALSQVFDLPMEVMTVIDSKQQEHKICLSI